MLGDSVTVSGFTLGVRPVERRTPARKADINTASKA